MEGNSMEEIKRCMDHQFEKVRDDEITEMIKDAEHGKAAVLKPPGIENKFKSTWEIDEEHFQFGAHIDASMTGKIERGGGDM